MLDASLLALPSMAIKRQCFSMTGGGGEQGFILVSGGYNGTQRKIKSCDMFDLTSQKWRRNAPKTKEARYDHASIILQRSVAYLFGGMFHA